MKLDNPTLTFLGSTAALPANQRLEQTTKSASSLPIWANVTRLTVLGLDHGHLCFDSILLVFVPRPLLPQYMHHLSLPSGFG